MDMNEWEEKPEPSEVSLAKMDEMIAEYKDCRDVYEEKKKEASKSYEDVEKIQNKIMAALEAAGKKSYKVDGLGTFSVVLKQSVSMPKDFEEKRGLFSYIIKNYGVDVFESMVTIHYQSLNSFYNQEFEKAQDPMFHLPGVSAPTVKKEPRFTKAR